MAPPKIMRLREAAVFTCAPESTHAKPRSASVWALLPTSRKV
jgi:hypothetical protein